MKAPVKLGLAGGPLVVAIIGSWLGVKKGWFGTEFTEGQGVHALREVGIALFLAGVGLGAGGQFVETVQEQYSGLFTVSSSPWCRPFWSGFSGVWC